MNARFLFGILWLLIPAASLAQDLSLPVSATLLSERGSALDSYDLPTGAFSDGNIPVRNFVGSVNRKTWRINGTSATTLQLITPLRDQLENSGYDIVLECEARSCGGYDFRFGTEIVPAPDMHVDIGNYRFLSAINTDANALSILISRSGNAAYIQIVTVASKQEQQNPEGTAPPAAISIGNDFQTTLLQKGHVPLLGLDFDTGAGALLPGPHDSLERIATFLNNNPSARIALVGHTDTVGSLQSNIALSKQRAEAVRNRLISDFGIAPSRLDAEGMGYLAPIASNENQAGREANRRVEAVLLPAL